MSKAVPAPVKRRKWYLGIQSKKDPAHVMTEVIPYLCPVGAAQGLTTGLSAESPPSASALDRGSPPHEHLCPTVASPRSDGFCVW